MTGQVIDAEGGFRRRPHVLPHAQEHSVLLVSPYDHSATIGLKIQPFARRPVRFPLAETWIRKEFRGFSSRPLTRLPKNSAKA